MCFFGIFKKKNRVNVLDTYMARDLKEIEDALIGASFPKWEDKEAYIHKLFFSSVEEGGFGFSIEKRNTWFCGGKILWKLRESLNYLRTYKQGAKLNNYWFEYARLFFQKGLAEPDSLVMEDALRRIGFYWGKSVKGEEDGTDSRWCFYRQVISNPESFLYDERLYKGDVNFVVYKLDFCFKVFYSEEFLKLRENITLDEVLSAPSKAYLARRVNEIESED